MIENLSPSVAATWVDAGIDRVAHVALDVRPIKHRGGFLTRQVLPHLPRKQAPSTSLIEAKEACRILRKFTIIPTSLPCPASCESILDQPTPFYYHAYMGKGANVFQRISIYDNDVCRFARLDCSQRAT